VRASGSSSTDISKPGTHTHRLYSNFGFRDKTAFLAGMEVPFKEDEPALARVQKIMGPVAALATSIFCKEKKGEMHPYCLALVTDCSISGSEKRGRSVRLVLRPAKESYAESAPVAVSLPLIGNAVHKSAGADSRDRTLNCKCVVAVMKDAAKAHPGDVLVAELNLDLPGADQKELAGICQPGSAPADLKNPAKLTLAERLDTVSLDFTYEDKAPAAGSKTDVVGLYDRNILFTATPHYRPHGGTEKKTAPKKGDTMDQALAECKTLVRSNLERSQLIDGTAVEILKIKIGIAKTAAASPPFLEIQLLASGKPQLCAFGSGVAAPALRVWGAPRGAAGDDEMPMPYQVRVEYGPSARILLGDRVSCPAGGIVIRAASASNIIRGQYSLDKSKKPIPKAHPDAAYMIIADAGHSVPSASHASGTGSACVLLASGSHEVGGGECPFFPPATLAENVFDEGSLAAPCTVSNKVIGGGGGLGNVKTWWKTWGAFGKPSESLTASGLEALGDAEHLVSNAQVDSTASLREALVSLVFPPDVCDQLQDRPPLLSFDYATGDAGIEKRFVISGDRERITYAGVDAATKACKAGEKPDEAGRANTADVFNDSTEFNDAIGKSPFSNFVMVAHDDADETAAPAHDDADETAAAAGKAVAAHGDTADTQLAPAVLAFETSGLVLRRNDTVMQTKEVITSLTYQTGGTPNDSGTYDDEKDITVTVDSIEHVERGRHWGGICLGSGECAYTIETELARRKSAAELADSQQQAESLSSSATKAAPDSTESLKAAIKLLELPQSTADLKPCGALSANSMLTFDYMAERHVAIASPAGIIVHAEKKKLDSLCAADAALVIDSAEYVETDTADLFTEDGAKEPKLSNFKTVDNSTWTYNFKKPWEQYVFTSASANDSPWRYHYVLVVMIFGILGHLLLRFFLR
jgi:hypothetical protein